MNFSQVLGMVRFYLKKKKTYTRDNLEKNQTQEMLPSLQKALLNSNKEK